MADARADECIREQEQLESRRALWDGHWQEIADRVRPNLGYFQQRERTEGAKRNEKIFDSTAPLALPKFGAAATSLVIPANQKWHGLCWTDEELNDDPECKKWAEQVVNILFKVRYSPKSNFQSQSGEVMLDIGAFGTGILFVDDIPGVRINYKSFPLFECYISEDANGSIDTNHRKFEYTAHQAVAKFGMKRLPEHIKRAYETDKQQKFEFLHCVMPNPEKIARRKDWRGMDYWSCYIAKEGRTIVDEGGFRVFPFAIPRYETNSREIYGRSPAMTVLQAIKTLNEQKKTVLRAGQRVVDPPIMLTDDGSLAAFNVRPNALNYGYVDANGRPMAIPFQSNARVDIGLDMMNAEREAINDGFLVTLFRILVEEPQITATEAMLRAQEKGQLLAPTMGRLQSDFCGPIIQREIDILMAAGVLPPMPQKALERGANLRVEYTSPLNLAQRAADGVAILNTVQAVTPIAQIKPDVLNVFKWADTVRELAAINGVPAKLMNDDDELAAMDEQTAQAQQAQMLLQAAPVAASSVKDLAQAQALAGSAPNGQAPAILPE